MRFRRFQTFFDAAKMFSLMLKLDSIYQKFLFRINKLVNKVCWMHLALKMLKTQTDINRLNLKGLKTFVTILSYAMKRKVHISPLHRTFGIHVRSFVKCSDDLLACLHTKTSTHPHVKLADYAWKFNKVAAFSRTLRFKYFYFSRGTRICSEFETWKRCSLAESVYLPPGIMPTKIMILLFPSTRGG